MAAGAFVAIVHVTPHTDAVDLAHIVGEEVGDVLVRLPVDRHAQLVAVPFAEAFADGRTLEPVVTEPIEIGELLVGQLIDLAVRRGGEAEPNEIVEIECRQRIGGAVAGDPFGQRHGAAVTPVGTSQVAVVDVGVVKVTAGAHLRFQALYQLAFPDQILNDADIGDLAKGTGEIARLVLMRRKRLRDDVDLLAAEWLCGSNEERHLRHLFIDGESRGGEFGNYPTSGSGHAKRVFLGVRPRCRQARAQTQRRRAAQNGSPCHRRALSRKPRFRRHLPLLSSHGVHPSTWIEAPIPSFALEKHEKPDHDNESQPRLSLPSMRSGCNEAEIHGGRNRHK